MLFGKMSKQNEKIVVDLAPRVGTAGAVCSTHQDTTDNTNAATTTTIAVRHQTYLAFNFIGTQ